MLNPIEQDKIQQLLGDELMLKIIEKVFNATMENNLPQINVLDDNQKLGEKYRAYETAKWIVRKAFSDLLSHKQEPENKVAFANKGK